jgi:hypothetical protein
LRVRRTKTKHNCLVATHTCGRMRYLGTAGALALASS